MPEEMFFEESVESKITGIEAEMNQMIAMIAENERLIAEGDDVEGRTFLMKHLRAEVFNCQRKIDQLNGLPSREEAIELQGDLTEAYTMMYGGEAQ